MICRDKVCPPVVEAYTFTYLAGKRNGVGVFEEAKGFAIVHISMA